MSYSHAQRMAKFEAAEAERAAIAHKAYATRLRACHGPERAAAILAGTDGDHNRDVAAWRALGAPKLPSRSNLVPHVSPKAIGAIVARIAAEHGLQPHDLTGHDRFGHFLTARFEAMWTVRHETKASYPQIGRAFGGRDHTTAINAVRQHAKRLAETTPDRGEVSA